MSMGMPRDSTSTSRLSGSAAAILSYVATSGTTYSPLLAHATATKSSPRLIAFLMTHYCSAHGIRHLLLHLPDRGAWVRPGRADDVPRLLRAGGARRQARLRHRVGRGEPSFHGDP